ncbi:hypothetical protein BZA70DRAFT_278515 [Myxozyma melibiosi]|uniref:NADPH-dependent FMN and FAD-containing oxidoreductase n=1 Tax=Myxozyma melibiosi TaxID=54550 RepID=A0ABR1F6X1_9ASCO
MTAEHGPSVAIVYFSETGTAQSLAENLCKRVLRLRFRASVLDADDVERVYRLLLTPRPAAAADDDTDSVPIVIFVCSTTGNGEVPRHARRLWRALLRRKLTSAACAGIQFTTFGLGDSAYARFNWTAKKLHKRMLQLGASEFCTRAEGDEAATGGIEAAYSAWASSFCEELSRRFPLAGGSVPIPEDVVLSPLMPVSVLDDEVAVVDEYSILQSRTTAASRVGTVTCNQRITPSTHFQDTRIFKLSPDPTHTFPALTPGATLLIYSRNNDADVSSLIESQNWTPVADKHLSVPPAVRKWATTTPLTLRSLLTYHLDITAVPRATFFDTLSFFSRGNEQQRIKLKEFGDAGNEEFTQDRYDYADRPRRSALECLTEFDSVKVPVEYVLDVFSQLRPRQYSIAGWTPSSSSSPEIELLIAIVRYQTVLRRVRKGVCSTYIADLSPGASFLYEISAPQTTPPPADKPVVLVGPGTGGEIEGAGGSAESVLVFGNRSRAADFYYLEDWHTAISPAEEVDDAGIVTISSSNGTSSSPATVYACFSRDGNKLRYVQNVLSRPAIAAHVADMLVNRGGYVWVCGSKGKMPRAVRTALVEALDGATGGNGEGFVAELDRSGRYLEETW